MPYYLVTGRAGSGKSAVMRELMQRGYVAMDTDTLGIAQWQNNQGEKVEIIDARYVDLDTCHWMWDADKLKNVLSENDDALFICGSAYNDLKFTNLFDKVFVLDVMPDTQIERLKSRTDNDYGKDPRMHARVVDMQKTLVAQCKEIGCIPVDANRDIALVVDDILGHIK